MFKKLFKWSLYLLLFVIITLGAAYWTAPYWVPNQVQSFLPDNLKLQKLELQRPTLNSAQVNELSLHLDGEQPLDIELSNVTLNYSLLDKKLHSIYAEFAKLIIPESQQIEQQTNNQIPLPSLPLDSISIKELVLEGLLVQDIVLQDLQVKQKNNKLHIDTNLNFFGFQFQVSADTENKQQLLQELILEIRHQESLINLKIHPDAKNHSQWNWQSDAAINTEPFIALEAIDQFNYRLAGSYSKLKHENAFINHLDFSEDGIIQLPLNFESLDLQKSISEFLKENGIAAKVAELSGADVRLQIPAKTRLEYLANQDKNLTLQNGLLALEILSSDLPPQPQSLAKAEDLPQIKVSTIFNAFDIKIDKPWNDPTQLVAADIRMDLNLEKLAYIKDTLKANFAKFTSRFNARFKHEKGLTSVDSTQWDMKISPLRIKDKTYLAILPTTQWIASGQWQIDDLEKFNITKQEINLKLKKSIKARINIDKETFDIEGLNAEVNLDPTSKPKRLRTNYSMKKVALSEQPLILDNIYGDVDINLDTIVSKGTTNFRNSSFNNEQFDINYVSGQAKWTKKGELFTATGHLKQSQTKIPFSYYLDLEKEKHRLKLDHSKIPLMTLKSWMKLFNEYPSLHIGQGDLDIKSLNGDPIDLLFDGHLNLQYLDLSYDELKINNWSIDERLNTNGAFNGNTRNSIESIDVASGIKITDVTFEMQHTLDLFIIKKLHGDILQGSIDVPVIKINESVISPFEVSLEHINMNQLLTAFNSESLSIQGFFDIHLPVSISKENQQITNGTFKNTTPGILVIKNDDGEDANIAYQALDNFHYSEFNGTINYDEHGNYKIVLHLLGANPDLYDGFPIKLDLTLRGQLPDLLYSMFVTGDMAKPVLDTIQQKQDLNIQP